MQQQKQQPQAANEILGYNNTSINGNDGTKNFNSITRWNKVTTTYPTWNLSYNQNNNVEQLVSENPNIVNHLTRIYQPWNATILSNDNKTNSSNNIILQQEHKFGWCTTSSNLAGIYFTKIPKSASSTGAATTFQIARNIYQRLAQKQDFSTSSYHSSNSYSSKQLAMIQKIKATYMSCNHWTEHGDYYTKRQSPYLAWTILRHPAKRAISAFWFFQVTRAGAQPTTSLLKSRLNKLKSYSLEYIAKQQQMPTSTESATLRYNLNPTATSDNDSTSSVLSSSPEQSLHHAMEMIQYDVLNVYNFIAIAERIPESLVVLKLLFGLEFRDVIVLSSKTQGGYDDGKYKNTCFRIQSPNVTPTMEQYLKNEFPIDNYDYFLYAVANQSLDRTIDALGRDLVETQVEEFVRLQTIAEEHCRKEAIFPCSNNGTLQREASLRSCYKGDHGCGYKCVNRVLAKHL